MANSPGSEQTNREIKLLSRKFASLSESAALLSSPYEDSEIRLAGFRHWVRGIVERATAVLGANGFEQCA